MAYPPRAQQTGHQDLAERPALLGMAPARTGKMEKLAEMVLRAERASHQVRLQSEPKHSLAN